MDHLLTSWAKAQTLSSADAARLTPMFQQCLQLAQELGLGVQTAIKLASTKQEDTAMEDAPEEADIALDDETTARLWAEAQQTEGDDKAKAAAYTKLLQKEMFAKLQGGSARKRAKRKLEAAQGAKGEDGSGKGAAPPGNSAPGGAPPH